MLQFFRISGRRLLLAAAMTVLWLLLSGYWNNATLIGFGVFSIALTLWLADRADVIDREGAPSTIFPGLVPYMGWLLLEIGKSNLMVAREVLRPQIKLAPKMIRVAADQPSDLTRTIFGNSVTLTPGTVTVDVRSDSLLIHALDESFADVEGIEAMGAKVTSIDRGGRV